MNSLYYTLKDRKSLKTLRIEYGQLGLRFVMRMFEGQIDRRGEWEVSSRVDEEGKLHFRIHDVILSDPNDKGDEQDLYVTVERIESAEE